MGSENLYPIQNGKYKFNIKETISIIHNVIFSSTYTIGGDYQKCASANYKYSNEIPVSVSLPHLLYEPECAIGSNLARGDGSILMINTLLNFCYNKYPTITLFDFDDMSHIDCIEKDYTLSPPRNSKKPLNLAFFSIAYHDKTWYEIHFNAEMKDKVLYKKYRESLKFLTNPQYKVEYIRFLEIAQPPTEQVLYLEPLYNSAKTYREFFKLIPREKRCNILYDWLSTFMKFYIGDVFKPTDWQIDSTKLKIIPKNMTGGYTCKQGRTKKKRLTHIFQYNTIQSL
jgi:hypothetical protein